MKVEVKHNSFPNEIKNTILEVLDTYQEPTQVRNMLRSLHGDLWVVTAGTNFSFRVSIAAKSSGRFLVKTQQKTTHYLIYVPPFRDLSVPLATQLTAKTPWKVTFVKLDLKELEPEFKEIVKQLDYISSDKACETLQYKLNLLSPYHWHVFVGKDYVCALPKNEPEYLAYYKVSLENDKKEVVVFKQKGLKREVKWTGLGTWLSYVAISFLVFFAVIGYLKCTEDSTSLICRHQDTITYSAICMVFSKVFNFGLQKLTKLKNS